MQRLEFVSSGHLADNGVPDPSLCEDAEPLHVERGDGSVVVAVADGLGGYRGGRRAARVIRDVVARFAEDEAALEHPPGGMAASLTGAARERLIAEASADPTPPTRRLRGGLVSHAYATTLAGALVAPGGERGHVRVRCFWIGDSRVYWLSRQGLHQISTDDSLDGGDALQSLGRTPSMSQFLAASMPPTWEIHCTELLLPTHGLLVACTDGCYGGWNAPWDFERVLVFPFCDRESWGEWLAAVRQAIDGVKQDDASLVALPLGPTEFAKFSQDLVGQGRGGRACYQASFAARNVPADRVWDHIYKPVYEGWQGAARRLA